MSDLGTKGSRDTQGGPYPKKSRKDAIVSRELSSSLFIKSVAHIRKDIRVIESSVQKSGYTLNALAENFGFSCQVESGLNDDTLKIVSDEYAKDFITHLLSGTSISSNLRVEAHPDLVFNHRKVEDLPGLYDKENKADVSVMSVSGQGSDEKRTNLVNIQIKSSPMEFSVVNHAIHGLCQLVRVVKAHGVHDVALVGFTLPKLFDKGIAVRVTVKYDPRYMAFDVNCHRLSHSEFGCELEKAIEHNREVLTKCVQSKFEYCGRYAVRLFPEEMTSSGGTDPIQCVCNNGVRFEVKENGEIYCFKKPTLASRLYNITVLPEPTNDLVPFVITYGYDPLKRVVKYRKVKYDPLTYEQAEKCLHALITQLRTVCSLLQKQSIVHNDVRVPNICFSENYSIVLIDFDHAEILQYERPHDLSIFTHDMIENSQQDWIRSNKFLSKLSKGEWRSDLLEDIKTQCSEPIEQVIQGN